MMEPLGDEVRRELGRFGPESGISAVVDAWPAAVGAEIARNAWPARIQRDGTLVVHVRDSIWGFELGHCAGEIAGRLPGVPPLKFVPGPLPEPSTPEPPTPVSGLPDATPEEAFRASRWAAEIADDGLRELVARAARASLVRARNDRSV
jgi:hypothetical protein